MNLKDIDWGYLAVTLFFVILVIAILTGCGWTFKYPDIQAAEDRQKAIQWQPIPPPGCERKNTFVYGREAGCK